MKRKLDAGDYSILGQEDSITVERKTKRDAYSCLGTQRKRFKREIAKLAGYRYAAVVIECGLREFLLEPPAESQLSPKAAVNSLLSWSVRHGLHVWFADSRDLGEALTLRILEKFAKDCERKDREAPA